MRKKEKLTLHFDLSHCPQDVEFTLQAGGGKNYILKAYKNAPGKLEAHKKQNKALALIPPDKQRRITHFVEDAEMYADKLSVRRVVYPSIDDHPLPELALVFVHIPSHHQRKAIREISWKAGEIAHPLTLAYYGVPANAVKEEDMDEIRLHAAQIKPPSETAKSIVFHHPEIGTVNSKVAQTVFEKHVKHTQDYKDLIQYIENNPPESETSWYKKSYASSYNPDTKKFEPMEANLELQYKDGKTADWPDDWYKDGKPVMPLYDMTDEFNSQDSGVIGAAAPVVFQVLKDTKNDDTLNGQLWTKQDGTTEKVQTDVPPAPAAKKIRIESETLKTGASAKGFGIKNITSSYGLNLYDDELKYDYDKKTLSFPVKNWPNRYLSAYVQFIKSDGTPIKRKDIPDWDDRMPEFLRSILEPSDTKNYLDWISSGNLIFGVPVPPLTNKTTLEFIWPEEATRAEVLLGGLGAAEGFKDWDSAVDVVGVLGTGFVCYGVSALSLALTVYIVNPFVGGLKGDAKIGFYAVCGVIGASALVIGALEYKTSTGKYLLSTLANMAAGIIFGTAAQKIAEKIFKEALEKIIAATAAEITTEEALGEIPYVGWALKIASVAADIAAMTATTIECLLSPATYKLDILHTMNLTVTVKPDPAHGKKGQNPNWPLVSDHYVIQVKYPKGNSQEGGTTYTKAGPMPGQHDQPITVTFDKIPAGGKVEVVANIYSDNDWLAGRWDSGWINADPDKDDRLEVEGNIKENLVPLTATTIYSQKQTLAYSDAEKHYWQVTKFSISDTLADDLDKGGKPNDAVRAAFLKNGNDLSQNTSITVKTKGSKWDVTDKAAAVTFDIIKKEVYNDDGQTLYELEVQNITKPAPALPPVIQDCGPDGNRLCERMNITINNKEYQLGYAWRASGQNMPRDYGATKDNGQMYTFQSISTLGQPQDSIIQPTRGFSNPSYIAFDQFGLISLFDLDPAVYKNELNKGGNVPQDIAAEFGKYGVSLPQGTQITVIEKDKSWELGLPGENPLYNLRTVTIIKDGKQKDVISVFSWPVPKLDNFYLDSRTYTPENRLYYLRGVKFPLGESTFDYDTTKSWGSFQDVTIKDIAVHPLGYVVGADYDNHKLLALRLPAEAVDEKDAPIAMPLSGDGLREGLMNKPVALTITSDGRILILEEGNKRIQAFDVKGNPVPCFSVAQTPWKLNAKFISKLDSRSVETDLIQAFQENVTPLLAPLFPASMSSVTGLNNGQVDEQLTKNFIDSGYAQKKNGDPKFSVIVTQKDRLWLVTESGSGAVYDVRVMADNYGVDNLYIFHNFALAVTVKSPGQSWLISDTQNAMTFNVTKPVKQTDLTVQRLVSVMPLREQDQGGIFYLDIAVETKGYIYVLSKLEKGGTPEYRLDIYNPGGTPLLDKPQTGVNAAKLTVDQWRSLFTMNFEKFSGPGGRTEPGISEWEPSTPEKPSSKS